MSATQARHDAPLLVVVIAGGELSERTIDSLDAATGRHDRIVVVTPTGARPSAALRRIRAEAIDEAAVAARVATHAAAGGTTVLLVGNVHGPERTWVHSLAATAEAAERGKGAAALACTNAAPWPACPRDLPDATASRSEWRTFARSLADRLPVEVRDRSGWTGGAIAVTAHAMTALGPVAAGANLTSVPDLAGAVASAGGRVVRADAVYVHDQTAEALLSACLIMKDEEANLPRCLDSLRDLVDEVVVYDTGSSDGSVELARSLGAVVIEGMWDDDFARARNAARSFCRGRWLLHVDADEEVEDPVGAERLRNVLAGNPAADLVALPLYNLRGTELAPVRDANPHWVPRVLRRTRCHWTGALHEHPMLVTGGMPRTVRGSSLSLLHYGYLDEVVARLDKTGRNARIASTKLDDVGEAGRTHFDRGRTAAANGRIAEALDEYALAVATATNPVHRRCAMELAASTLLNVNRADEAWAWIERRAEVPEQPGVVRWLQARHAIAVGNPARALEHLDGITDYTDNFSNNGPDGVHHMRAEALLSLGRTEEAAAELVAAVAVNPTFDRGWMALMKGADRWPDALTEAAGHLRPDQLKLLAARLLKAPPPLAGVIAEAFWRAHPGAPVLLAVAVKLAPQLGLEEAAHWAVRLRGAGLKDSCPLRTLVDDVDAPPLLRLQAAHLGAELFGDAAFGDRRQELLDALAATT